MTPEIVGRYELVRPLGAGGMGEVFLARDQTLHRLVAVKRVHAGDARAAKYILHEARVIASLDHPNIATVYDVVEHNSQAHIVMEYIDGTTLAARMSAGPMSEAQVIDYGRHIAGALAYAHGRNVVHCDIKPSNVMVTATGVAKVLDFGIARRDSTTSHDATTATHAVIGTPPYMAPEVLLGAPPTPLSDVFGLGVMLYELVSGRRPYDGRDGAAVLHAMASPAPALDSAIAGISRELSGVVARAIATDPKLRLPSAQEFKRELDRIASGETATVSRSVRRSTAGKSMALLAALAIVCAALVAGVPRVASRAPKQSVLGVMFFNNTGQAENDYLAAGVSDVLLSHLAGAPGVTVVARTAMPSLTASTQVPEAVKALGLSHVLTGSVQRSGNSLRLTIGLVDRSGALKWSRSVDGVVSDLFHLEGRVSEAALSGLRSEGLVSSAIVQQARERPPTSNPDAFDDYAHGRALLERADVPGNLDRALPFLRRAVDRDAAFARAHAAIGEVYWRQHRVSRDPAFVDKSRAALLDALRLAPDDITVAYTLAMIEHGTGRLSESISILEAVLAKQPANDDAHRLLGRIHSDRGDFDRAIEEFREAQSIRPDYPANVRELGLAYYEKGRFDEAIASFTRLTTLQPDSATNYQLLGVAYQAASQPDRALAAYTQSNAIAPRATSYSNIGTIHYSRADYPAAIAAYRQAIAIQSKEATTHRNLADALWLNGDKADARREYESAITLATDALKINPSTTRLRSLIAYCHARLGNFSKARTLLGDVARSAPQDSDAAYKQAVVETLAGDTAAALRHLERALSLGYSRALVASDRDLDAPRSLPEFKALVR